MDTYSRLVLSIIALCLLALVLGRAGLLPGLDAEQAPAAVSAGPAAGADSEDRFRLTPIRVPPNSFYLVRHDHHTGQTWKVDFPSTIRGWDQVPEAEEAKVLREARREENARKAAERAAAKEAGEIP